jgi:hypothetical protein
MANKNPMRSWSFSRHKKQTFLMREFSFRSTQQEHNAIIILL